MLDCSAFIVNLIGKRTRVDTGVTNALDTSELFEFHPICAAKIRRVWLAMCGIFSEKEKQIKNEKRLSVIVIILR